MKPLEGIRVIDFTQAHAGSLATMLLADYGAEVIKIERAGVGDLARYWEPMVGEDSGYYAFLNRNKKSIAVNAGDAEGKEIIFRLIKDADVVCENFKYGSMERMGFDYETLKMVNPELIYASLNGFGQTGVMKDRIGLDIHLQAMSGIMDRTGFPDGHPTRVGAAFGDHLSGMYMAIAVNLALINKKRTGRGQKIDISILDSLFSVLEEAPVTCELKGENLERTGNAYPFMAPFDTLKTCDGYVSVAVTDDDKWKSFCQALDLQELYEDPRFISTESRCRQYHDILKPELEKVLRDKSKFDLAARLNGCGVPSGPVLSVDEMMDNEHIAAREIIKEVEDRKLGPIRYPGPVIRMSETPGSIDSPAPIMGADTRSYLSNIGYSDSEIDILAGKGIIDIEAEVVS